MQASPIDPTAEHGYTYQSKRMRLGTKSCAECRRRKVRCILPSGGSVCEGCALHQVPCRPQQPRTKVNPKGQNINVRTGKSSLATGRRLEELEELVRGLCSAMGLDFDSSTVTEFKDRSFEMVQRLREQSAVVAPAQVENGNGSCYTTSTIPSVQHTDINNVVNHATDDDFLDGGPLMSLFRDALFIQKPTEPTNDDTSPPAPSSTNIPSDITNSISSLTLTPIDLLSILQFSQKYWLLWPPCFYGPKPSDRPQPEKFDEAKYFVESAFYLKSNNQVRTAKALLFLSLCIQQSERQWIRQNLHLPEAPGVLIDGYITIAETILHREGRSAGSVDSLDCFLVLWKLYINAGKPRRAWCSLREGINRCILLGLHLNTTDDNNRGRLLWSQLWQSERQMSVLLGLPTSVPAYLIPTLNQTTTKPSLPPHQLLFLEMSHISASVISRDQTTSTTKNPASYAITVQLDSDIEQSKLLVPPSFWGPPEASFPLSTVYYRETTKIQYFILLKLIHMPYMVKAYKDRKYYHSRLRTLEASKGLITAYLGLRGWGENGEGRLVVCELMDFQAFSAGVVIAIDLLSERSSSLSASVSVSDVSDGAGGRRTRTLLEENEDWNLISTLISNLQHTAVALDCGIAAQSAQVLTHLLSSSGRSTPHPIPPPPENYKVTIPYFGKLHISNLQQQQQQRRQSDGNDSDSFLFFPGTSMSSSSVSTEFTGAMMDFNDFEELGGQMPEYMDFTMGMELGVDWGGGMEFEGGEWDWEKGFTG